MELKSILMKALFIVTVILAILCVIDNETTNSITKVSIIPLFAINILIVVDSINKKIISISSERKQYYKTFESENTTRRKSKKEQIKKEIIYDDICQLFEIKINRIISWIMVVVIVGFTLLMIFHQKIDIGIADLGDLVSILLCTLLIVDINYKEKIAKKIINKIYKYKIKNFKYR